MNKLIVLALVAGVLCGYFIVDPTNIAHFEITLEWALILLLFAVGIEFGLNKNISKQLRTLPKVSLLLPFIIAAFSLGGALLANLIIGLHPLEAATVAGGFGWYSLSGIIISQTYDTALGTLAFLANIIRELIAIITIPWIAKHLGYLSAVAPGGATTMDVTLPLIAKNTNTQTTILAFYSGTVLTLLVPILVPFFIKWAQLL